MVFSHQSKTTTRQRQDTCWTCAFLWCLSHLVCRTWCERHNRNALVVVLSSCSGVKTPWEVTSSGLRLDWGESVAWNADRDGLDLHGSMTSQNYDRVSGSLTVCTSWSQFQLVGVWGEDPHADLPSPRRLRRLIEWKSLHPVVYHQVMMPYSFRQVTPQIVSHWRSSIRDLVYEPYQCLWLLSHGLLRGKTVVSSFGVSHFLIFLSGWHYLFFSWQGECHCWLPDGTRAPSQPVRPRPTSMTINMTGHHQLCPRHGHLYPSTKSLGNITHGKSNMTWGTTAHQ